MVLGDCTNGGVGISARYSDKKSANSALSSNKFLFPNTITNCFLETHHLLNTGDATSIGVIFEYLLKTGTINDLLFEIKLHEVGKCDSSAILPSNVNVNEKGYEFFNLKLNTNYILVLRKQITDKTGFSGINIVFYKTDSNCKTHVGTFKTEGLIHADFNQYIVPYDTIYKITSSNFSLPTPFNGNESMFGYLVFSSKQPDIFNEDLLNPSNGFIGISKGDTFIDTSSLGYSKIQGKGHLWLYPATFDKKNNGILLDANNDLCYSVGTPIHIAFASQKIKSEVEGLCGDCFLSLCPIAKVYAVSSPQGSQNLTDEFNFNSSVYQGYPPKSQGPVEFKSFHYIFLKSENQMIGVKQALNFAIVPSNYQRKAILRKTCTSEEIPATRLNANNLGSGFNPEWDNLKKGEYVLEIQNSIPKDGNLGYFITGFYVVPDSLKVSPATSITISSTPANVTDTMTMLQMKAVVSPLEAKQNVTWSVTPSNLAKINTQGLLQPFSNGTVTVKAIAQDGTNISSTKEVIINNANVLAKKVEIGRADDDSTIIANKGKVQFGLYFLPLNVSKKSGTWSVSPDNLATIDQNGLFIPSGTGVFTITFITDDGSNLTATYKYEIKQKVESISIETPINTPNIVDTMTYMKLSVIVLPINALDKSVSWSISPSDVAKIDQNGLITPIKNGTITVTASANDGSKVKATKTIQINNSNVKVKNINITYIKDDSLIMSKGGVVQFSTYVLPLNVSNKNVTWSVTPESLATISTTGLMTPKGKGQIVVKATAQDGSGIFDTIVLNANNTTLQSSIYNKIYMYSGDSLLTRIGDTLQFKIQSFPVGSITDAVNWSVSPTGIVALNTVYGFVEALKPGVAILTATSIKNPNLRATKQIIVDTSFIPVKTIDLFTATGDTIINTPNGTLQLKVKLFPSNATDSTLVWSVSPAELASITQDGLLIAKGNGVVTVTVTTNRNYKRKVYSYNIEIKNQTTNNLESLIESNVNFQPNPTSSLLYFNQEIPMDLLITDCTGKSIKPVFLNKQTLDFTDFENGIYFIHNKPTTYQFVVSH